MGLLKMIQQMHADGQDALGHEAFKKLSCTSVIGRIQVRFDSLAETLLGTLCDTATFQKMLALKMF